MVTADAEGDCDGKESYTGCTSHCPARLGGGSSERTYGLRRKFRECHPKGNITKQRARSFCIEDLVHVYMVHIT